MIKIEVADYCNECMDFDQKVKATKKMMKEISNAEN